MNETYGLKFEAIIGEFKEKLRSLSNSIRNFGKEAEKNVTISPTINLKELYKWREEVEKLLQATRENQAFSSTKEVAQTYDKDIQWYETSLNAINDRIKEIEKSEEQVNETSEKSKSILSEMFDRSIAKIKRFTFYLLGARSVFSLFMKYQSIYYQYNEQMQYQSELSQNAIALSLAPAFEFLGNVIAYASIAFAKFIELLTGVNVLTKVSTKGIRDYNKGLKESQTLLSGIDEITNLTMPTGTGLASQYQALNDFQKKIAEVEKFFQDNKWISDLAKGLKKVFEIIGQVIDGVGGIENALLLLGGVKVMSSLGTLLGTAGVAGVGAKGLLGILAVSGLVAEGLHKVYQSKLGKNFQEDIDKLNEIKNTFTKDIDYYKFTQNLSDIEKVILPNIANMAKKDKDAFNDVKDEINGILTELEKITGIDYKKQLQLDIEFDPKSEEGFFNGIKSGFNTMINGFKDNIEGSDWEKSWDYFNKRSNNAFDDAMNYANKKVDEVRHNLNDTFKDRQANVTFNVNGNTSQLDKAISNTLKKYGFSVGGGGILAIGGGGFVAGGSRGYANGLDYVPYDNFLALLHKGESVVPSKYNPTIHGMSNDYTNSLLETLIVKMDDLSRRPNEFIVDGKKFASATYEYYQDEDSRQNYLKGVVAK